MTSQACSDCHNHRVTFYDRNAYCRGCRKSTDRDVAAARNIRYVLLCKVGGKTLPTLMCRKQANPTNQH